jgi:hypothetical protein
MPLRIAAGDRRWRSRAGGLVSLQSVPTPDWHGLPLRRDLPESRVRLEGERKIYERTGDSGYRIRFHFCPKCGSNVYWEGDSDPAVCGITVGSFADPNFPLPTYSQWEDSKHEWLGVSIAAEHYPQGRPPRT